MSVETGQKIWLKFYPPEVQPSYDYPKHNIAFFLQTAANRYPQHQALHFMGKELTYRELDQSARRFAQALRSLGINKGDRVAIMLPNCPQAVIAYYGSLMIGAIVVQTNPLYTERELLQQLKDSESKLLVTLDLLFKRAQHVMPQTNLEHLIITSMKDYLPFPKNVLYPLTVKKDGMSLKVEYGERVHKWKNVLTSVAPIEQIEEVDAENDLALLQYTGGTTGKAKGVMLTHYNLVVNTVQCRHILYKAKEGQERFLAALPFFHVYGLTTIMNLAIYMASVMLLVPKFDTNMMIRMLEKLKPTLFPGAPTMYISIINNQNIQNDSLSSIKACISGSAPLPVEVQERFEELSGGRLVEGYGLTETSPVTHSNMIWGKRKVGSIGIPWPDTDAKIVDLETGEDLPIGEIGELAIKGPQVMKGYWNNPEETEKVLKDGWVLTGDVAKMDEDGFFYIIERKKDLIIASGYNIYPREIEEVLYGHPDVQEAVVVGVPDDYRGETVKAIVVLKEGRELSSAELEQWCRKRLAAYKVPKQIEFRTELPKSIIGKVLRRVVREEMKADSKNADGQQDQTGA